MSHFPRWLSLTINLAIVLVTLALGAFFLKGMLPGNPENDAAREGLRPGRQLSAENIPWNEHDHTLILAIKRGCHFCEESMPFYRRLEQMEADGQFAVHVVAVLPDNPASARFYLRCQNLNVDVVPNVPLDTLDVSGTPTAILVDQHGTLVRAWDGALSPRQQRELISALVKVGSRR